MCSLVYMYLHYMHRANCSEQGLITSKESSVTSEADWKVKYEKSMKQVTVVSDELLVSRTESLESAKRLLEVEKQLLDADKRIIAVADSDDSRSMSSTVKEQVKEARTAEIEAEARVVDAQSRVVQADEQIEALQKKVKQLRGAAATAAATASSGSSSDKWGQRAGAPFPLPSHPKAVRCNDIKMNAPMRITGMQSIGAKYMVSYSWWGHRGAIIKHGGHKRNYKEMQEPTGNDSIMHVQQLINKSPPGSAFLDVGANVGFMTFYAPATGRPVYAFDPIKYDIQKICEGLLGNIWSEKFSWDMAKRVNIFHAAVGPENKDVVKMTRPSDAVGYFDQSSLSSSAVSMSASQTVTENVPMVRLDDIIPDDVPVGHVKIDVQGHEEGVLKGMTKILSRTTGYPSSILFEDDPVMTRKAGWTYGNAKKIIEAAGYTCSAAGVDQLCEK